MKRDSLWNITYVFGLWKQYCCEVSQLRLMISVAEYMNENNDWCYNRFDILSNKDLKYRINESSTPS